jgi:tRNA threonylcarbamoyl adenosine modification protein YeaZ
MTTPAAGTTGILLALDTATSRVVVARGGFDGTLDDAAGWPAGYRHGESLLPAIERLLESAGGRTSIGAVVVGTGPGAFTGLRVGIATAKGLAHGLGCPIVGVPTGLALLAAAPGAGALLLPAGPADRVLVRAGEPSRLLPGGTDPELRSGERLVAVDLDGRAPDDAVVRGRIAHDGLAAALLLLGAERLADERRGDDLEALVPDYVTLPRGVTATTGEVAWSHDPR